MATSSEEVARRYAAARSGCRLVDYREVALPVFSMHLIVLVLEPRQVPPTEEFLLRLLQHGPETPAGLAALLGLDRRIVDDRLVELRRQELIDVLPEPSPTGAVRCLLTERGTVASKSLSHQMMQEITIPGVAYHGLLRHPVQIGDRIPRRLMTPKEARACDLTLLPAIPNRYPYLFEIDVERLGRVVKGRVGRRSRSARDVVAVKGIAKKVHTLYEAAVMLEYEAEDASRDKQVTFAIDGQIAADLEDAFARANGVKVFAEFLSEPGESLASRVRRNASSDVVGRLGRLDDAEQLAARYVASEQEIEDAKRELTGNDRDDTKQVLRQKIAQLEDGLRLIGSERNSRKARFLWTVEIRKKLWEAIETAKDRLLILSGFISSSVVNEEFITAFENALKRGVSVWIGYGFDKDTSEGRNRRKQRDWVEAETALGELSSTFPRQLCVRDVGRSHEKRLICDDRFTFGGSFNFLSFSGESRGGGKVRHEGADLIEDAGYCEELYKRYLPLFFKHTA